MLTVAAFYKFSMVQDPDALRTVLFTIARQGGVRGTLILAREGINGTVAGPEAGLGNLIAAVRNMPGFADMPARYSQVADYPFDRLKVRIKPEIVTMGVPDSDPTARVGRYVDPVDWNALVTAGDVVVIDTRNRYEASVGMFAGAVNPDTGCFRNFPAWWDANKKDFAGRRVAMYCTGGIRCEKATSYVAADQGTQVFHLRGGILAYLEQVPPQASLWQGSCFVFDGRGGLGHGLIPSPQHGAADQVVDSA